MPARGDSTGAIDRRLSYLRGRGIDIRVDHNQQGHRFESGLGKPMSPRMKTKAEAINWLEAFETGWEIGREASKPALHIPECDCDVCDIVRKRKYREAESRK